MGDMIFAWAKEHFYFVLMSAGILVVIGCILDWKWITRFSSGWKMPFIRAFIEEMYGKEARYKFERFIMLVCGFILIICGLIFWYFYG